ncbi:MAG: hypothetical protein AAGG44_18215 [Planctomycetota bacterium]
MKSLRMNAIFVLLLVVLLPLVGCRSIAKSLVEGLFDSVVDSAFDDGDRYSRVGGAEMPERYQKGFREQERIDQALRDFDEGR